MSQQHAPARIATLELTVCSFGADGVAAVAAAEQWVAQQSRPWICNLTRENTVPTCILQLWLMESPRWLLLSSGRRDQAIKALTRARGKYGGDATAIEAEVASIEESVSSQQGPSGENNTMFLSSASQCHWHAADNEPRLPPSEAVTSRQCPSVARGILIRFDKRSSDPSIACFHLCTC